MPVQTVQWDEDRFSLIATHNTLFFRSIADDVSSLQLRSISFGSFEIFKSGDDESGRVGPSAGNMTILTGWFFLMQWFPLLTE